MSPANPGSSAATGDSHAFPGTNVASPVTKNGSTKPFREGHDNWVAVTSCLDVLNRLNHPLESIGSMKYSFFFRKFH